MKLISVVEVLNRISTREVKKSQPETERVEDCYLLIHELGFVIPVASLGA